MTEYSYDYAVLVIAEPDFVATVKDISAYKEKLQRYLIKRAGESTLRVVTLTGKYGVGEGTTIDVDDRNKTSFLKSLEDHLEQYNEVVFITNFDKDPYIDALGSRLTELSKPFAIYGYETIKHEKS